MIGLVIERAADLEDQGKANPDEGLARWHEAGGFDGGWTAAAWLSVAFLFARRDRVGRRKAGRGPRADLS